MSLFNRTYTFTDGTTAYGSQVESEIANIVAVLNSLDASSTSWTSLKAINSASTVLSVDNSNGSNNIAEFKANGTAKVTIGATGAITLGTVKISGLAAATTAGDALRYEQVSTMWKYRRPRLTYSNATQVAVEGNTSTLNQTTIIFPDGEVRTVTEDTGSSTKYRLFQITATAEFTTGTEDSGLRSGLSEAVDTWYAIYAVKSQIDSSKFVLAGDTTLPIQSSFSTLDTRYGANSWVYLGLIRNGNSSGATGDIVSFTQCGPLTVFSGTSTGQETARGILLATSASSTSLTYTYAAGTGDLQVPVVISHVNYHGITAGTTGGVTIAVASESTGAMFTKNVDQRANASVWVAMEEGMEITCSNAIAMDIFLSGFYDYVLAEGSHPLL